MAIKNVLNKDKLFRLIKNNILVQSLMMIFLIRIIGIIFVFLLIPLISSFANYFIFIIAFIPASIVWFIFYKYKIIFDKYNLFYIFLIRFFVFLSFDSLYNISIFFNFFGFFHILILPILVITAFITLLDVIFLKKETSISSNKIKEKNEYKYSSFRYFLKKSVFVLSNKIEINEKKKYKCPSFRYFLKNVSITYLVIMTYYLILYFLSIGGVSFMTECSNITENYDCSIIQYYLSPVNLILIGFFSVLINVGFIVICKFLFFLKKFIKN